MPVGTYCSPGTVYTYCALCTYVFVYEGVCLCGCVSCTCVCEWTASRFREARENEPTDCNLQSTAIIETAFFCRKIFYRAVIDVVFVNCFCRECAVITCGLQFSCEGNGAKNYNVHFLLLFVYQYCIVIYYTAYWNVVCLLKTLYITVYNNTLNKNMYANILDKKLYFLNDKPPIKRPLTNYRAYFKRRVCISRTLWKKVGRHRTHA